MEAPVVLGGWDRRGSRPSGGVNGHGRRFSIKPPSTIGRTHARACSSVALPAGSRAEIDALFAGEVDLPGVLEQVARLGARLINQTAVEVEVEEFLGLARYQRQDPDAVEDGAQRAGSRNGYRPVTVRTTLRHRGNPQLRLADHAGQAGVRGHGRARPRRRLRPRDRSRSPPRSVSSPSPRASRSSSTTRRPMRWSATCPATVTARSSPTPASPCAPTRGTSRAPCASRTLRRTTGALNSSSYSQTSPCSGRHSEPCLHAWGRAQPFAALNCSRTLPGMRPRAGTSRPFDCAQARTAFGS